jgi:predicted deacetylase
VVVGIRPHLCPLPHGEALTGHGRTEVLLVTIHDVTPALQPRVETLWRMCAERGVKPGLLIVPEWHGSSPVERDPAFGAWVRARAEDGAEIFLHGERHDEAGLPRTWRDDFRAYGRTNKEGEFLTLDYAAARERIDRGLERLRSIGLEPIGFVPPAWLAKPDTHQAVKDAGLAVSEDDTAIYAHRTDVAFASPVVRWSARGAFRAWGSVVQERSRWILQRRAAVVRIALHPADLDHPAVVRSLGVALDAWLSVRPATRYAAL